MAFDKVPYRLLMQKVYGPLDDKWLVDRIWDFLIGRKQKVKVGEYLSEEGGVTSGVRQAISWDPYVEEEVLELEEFQRGAASWVKGE
ncbi:hypothetical protein PR048_004951 [Dryococelus australis]|uniref:Uncharacterized protein n=1 Tax=Dryococelus australis TaxID=614101 RepID=A0ABQ9I7Q5_9NEOP|nr:hypothetical protein PR048_004951 [Dryococelus australis]